MSSSTHAHDSPCPVQLTLIPASAKTRARPAQHMPSPASALPREHTTGPRGSPRSHPRRSIVVSPRNTRLHCSGASQSTPVNPWGFPRDPPRRHRRTHNETSRSPPQGNHRGPPRVPATPLPGNIPGPLIKPPGSQRRPPVPLMDTPGPPKWNPGQLMGHFGPPGGPTGLQRVLWDP
jgi:hypothetical protein